MSFGDYLIRIRGKMSLRDAAKKTKISHTYLRDLEQGNKNDPSFEVLQNISEGYGIPMAELTRMAGRVAMDEVNKRFGAMVLATSLDNFLTQVEDQLLDNGQLPNKVTERLNQVLSEDGAAGITTDNFLDEVKNIRDLLIESLQKGEYPDELLDRSHKLNRARTMLYKLALGQDAADSEITTPEMPQLLESDPIPTHYELSKILGPASMIPVHFNNRLLNADERRRVLDMLQVLFPEQK